MKRDGRAGVTHRGFFVVVSGPSGVGKSTLVKALQTRLPEVRYSVSATTRPPRPGEQEGREYFFLSRPEFERRAAQGAFLEWAEFCGNLYGTPRQYIESCMEQGAIVIGDLDLQGALQVRERLRDGGVFVFLLPPSLDELSARIRRRAADPEEAIRERLDIATTELRAMTAYDYAIVNDNLERALEDLISIIRAERCRVSRSVYPQLLAGEAGS